MTRTNRALALLAGLALVLQVTERWLESQQSDWLSFAPGQVSVVHLIAAAVWTAAAANSGPCVWAVALALAAQSRRWGWCVALTLAGVLSLVGPHIVEYSVEFWLSSDGFNVRALLIFVATVALAFSAIAPALTLLFAFATNRQRGKVKGVERTPLSQER